MTVLNADSDGGFGLAAFSEPGKVNYAASAGKLPDLNFCSVYDLCAACHRLLTAPRALSMQPVSACTSAQLMGNGLPWLACWKLQLRPLMDINPGAD